MEKHQKTCTKKHITLSHAVIKFTETTYWRRNIHIQKKLKSNRTGERGLLTYNMVTWTLTKEQPEELNRAHQKQLRISRSDKSKK